MAGSRTLSALLGLLGLCVVLILPWARPLGASVPKETQAMQARKGSSSLPWPSMSLASSRRQALTPAYHPREQANRCQRMQQDILRMRATAGSSASSSVPGPPTSKVIDLGAGFSSNSIRHPLDLQYTRALQSLPGIDAVIRSVGGSVAEQVLGLDNVGRGVLVGPTQAPKIYNLLKEACDILQMKPPALYIRQNPNPNAYTLAISGRQPLIVVHTALIELMNEQELQAVIAHELGHLKCDHGVWLTIANLFSLGLTRLLPIPLFADTIEDNIMRWVRSAELTCDRAAMLVAQDSSVVMSVLMKLAGGCKALEGQLSVDAFLEQARTYEEAASTPIGWYLRNAEARQLTHPLPVMRAREIDQWSRSPEYRRLVKQQQLQHQQQADKS